MDRIELSGSELSAWVDQDSSVHIRAITKDGDPVELGESEAKALCDFLQYFLSDQVICDTEDVKDLVFVDSEKPLTDDDLKRAEKRLGVHFPDDFSRFYKDHNGGDPNRTVFRDFYGEIEDIEISGFMSILYRREFSDSPDFTLDGRAQAEWTSNKVPRTLLPFAMDWGGNYFCLGLDDGRVYYYVFDTWDEHLSAEENFAVNSTAIAPSFGYFIDHLQPSEE